MTSKSINPNLPPEPVHFVGAGGIGMSALAELLLDCGLKVSGSDLKPNANTARLIAKGATIAESHDASQVPASGSLIVSSAISADNPEVEQAKKLGIPVLHRSDLLVQLMQPSQRITVAGTHGKTTTSAMISYVFEKLGLDPTYAVGGCLNHTQSPVRLGHGSPFVAEVDESDGTISKFAPDIAVVTNVAPDHLDHFGHFDAIKSTFAKHLQKIRPDGVAILGWDNPVCRELAEHAKDHLGYGMVIGSDIRAVTPKFYQGSCEFLAVVERAQIPVRINAIGRYNIENALAAFAVAKVLELDLKDVAACLSEFPGVARRLELIHDRDSTLIYDDYAHNPGKIAAVVQALRTSFPEHRLAVAFQPHRYSRLATMYQEMTSAFAGSDRVYLLPVYAAGEEPVAGMTPDKIRDDISQSSQTTCQFFASFDELTNFVVKSNLDRTVFLTVGAGDVWQLARQIRDQLV